LYINKYVFGGKMEIIVDKLMDNKTKKQLKSDLKSMIRQIKIETNRLNTEIQEYIKTMDGFERFISESIFFIKDRYNLVSSHLLNLHKNRVLYIKSIIDRIANYSPSQLFLIGLFRNNFLKSNSELVNSILEVNKLMEKNVETLLQHVPDYIQNINSKIVSIIHYKKALEELKRNAIKAYKSVGKEIIIGNKQGEKDVKRVISSLIIS
jgi:hypothetical protein